MSQQATTQDDRMQVKGNKGGCGGRPGDGHIVYGFSDMCAPEVNDILKYHDGYEFFDENSGEYLNPRLVVQACRDELKIFEDMKVYSYCKRSDVPENSKNIGVKWVHVNKGSEKDHIIRCRLVCQDFNDGTNKDELFAGTPPLFVITHAVDIRLGAQPSDK